MKRNTSPTLFHDARRATATAAAILALTLGVAASATAFGGPGGPGGPGHPGARGDAFAPQFLESIRPKLNLNTAQQQLFDQAAAQGKSARETGRANIQRIQDAMRAELAKSDPDLAALAAIADEEQARNQALRKGVRDQWLKLYATFSAEQKAVVRDVLTQRMNRADGFRQKMRERWGAAGS
jgi:Spy/CpxP family protein refolding chaperone